MKALFDDLGFAKPEPQRIARQGFPEAIYCPGKTPAQIEKIFGSLLRGPGPVIATRLDAAIAQRLTRKFKTAQYHATARLVLAKPAKSFGGAGVAIVSAGTADQAIAEEAASTAFAMGTPIELIYDVGVACIDRLLVHRALLRRVAAVIVCAGMDGALPSVVGGLAACPVIAVPTSAGYGASFGGVAALLTMLNACTPNISVVNIDNGFSAGVSAALIARGSSKDVKRA